MLRNLTSNITLNEIQYKAKRKKKKEKFRPIEDSVMRFNVDSPFNEYTRRLVYAEANCIEAGSC